jgi:hypothetical protein
MGKVLEAEKRLVRRGFSTQTRACQGFQPEPDLNAQPMNKLPILK